MKYESIIFDLDGTLLESTVDHIEWIYECCEQALSTQNIDKDFSREEMGKLLGMDGYDEYNSMCEIAGVDPAEHWKLVTELRHQRKLEMLENNNLDLYPEAKETIRELHNQGLKIGLVSNAPEKTVNEVIEFFGLKKYIAYYRGTENHEDLKHRKPSARNLQIAIAELDRNPSIYVGNKKEDVEAAQNAGINSIIVKRDNTVLDSDPEILVECLSEIKSRLN